MGLQKLEDRGMILCEINEAFGNEMFVIFKCGYKQCRIIQDLHSKIDLFKHINNGNMKEIIESILQNSNAVRKVLWRQE